MRQLHAGQLVYHDFTKLRQARSQQRPSTTSSYTIITTPLLFSNSNHKLSTSLTIPHKTFFTSALQSRVTHLRLKQLERTANQNPTNASLQYDFLTELALLHPEAVIDRFENYPEYAIDERIALLYFGAMQRLNKGSGSGSLRNFQLAPFVKRLSSSGGIDPLKMQALHDLEEQKGKMTKGALATQTMQILSGAAVGMGLGGGTGGPVVSSGMMSPSALRGGDAKNPLHVTMHNPVAGRNAVLGVIRNCVVALILVSAMTALFDEKGGMGRAMGISSRNHVQESEGSDVKFDDVKGVTEAKAELEEIVEYLKNPAKFTRLGGKLPRGILLLGPPGTGKTLLAKAVAGEANVPFFFSSGSQFEEVYVGLGAKRVRELFEAAKKKSPAIIFIDEIDAVGGARKLKDQSAMKMTLNELLVQLDGFEDNSGIIVIGATNFANSLDQALLRPGRFDKRVTVALPDVGGRKEILEMYAAKTKLDDDVDLGVLARGTTGMSGADLYNLMNQAAVKASVDGLNAITMSVLEFAKDKILMGAELRSAVITPESARCTAYHEAGHALVATLTDGAMPIHKATIMPRGQSLGMVSMLPEGDQKSQSLKEMLAMMDVSMGGRVAEELTFGAENVTSGAMSDISNATRIARTMVTKYGFSENIGIVFHDGNSGEASSEETRGKIDQEVKDLTDSSYKRAKELLKKHSKEHKLLAEALMEYETLTGEEVRNLILKGKRPERPAINNDGGARGDRSVLEKKNGRKTPLSGLGGKVTSSNQDKR